MKFIRKPADDEWQSVPRSHSQHLRQYAKVVLEVRFFA
uniref:Uncharacterized protein n=1 Tax=Anopheles arabiensis TaxID=7173 RepID=A0A182IGJ6_ANOAR